MSKPRVLLTLNEPPNNSSGLGTLWAKLSIGLAEHIELDFLAPDLATCFATQDNEIQFQGSLFACKSPPLDRVSSVRRNGFGVSIWRKSWWTLVRAYSILSSKLGISGKTYEGWYLDLVRQKLTELSLKKQYEYFAVHVPSLALAKVVHEFCVLNQRKLILIIGDPAGGRHGSTFVPEQPELQQKMLDECAAFVTTEPTFSNYYSKHFSIDVNKLVYFSDCFFQDTQRTERSTPFLARLDGEPERSTAVRFVHWGAIASYRDPTPFINAIAKLTRQGSFDIRLNVAGKIDAVQQRKHAQSMLGDRLTMKPIGSYQHAVSVALEADIFLVIVSDRHMDNMPSKMIEGLSFERPMLLLANPNSAASKFVFAAGIGEVVSGESEVQIIQAIKSLTANYERFRNAFSHSLVQQFRVEVVGQQMGGRLSSVLLSEDT